MLILLTALKLDNSIGMLKNYLLTLLRLIKKKPGFYLLNIVALSISIATFLLILQYAVYHLRFDDFHHFKEDTYRVVLNYHREGRAPYIGAATFPRVGPALVEEFPEVELQCRIVPIPDGGSIYHKEQHFPVAHVQYVDTSFFDLFGFEILSGHSKTALQNVRTVLISDKIANTLFTDGNSLNQTIKLQTTDGSRDYLIGGVFEYRENTHLKSDILISFPSLLQIVGEEANTNWAWFDFVTYIKLKENTSPKEVEQKLPAFIDRHGGERLGSKAVSFTLQPLLAIHLKSKLNQEIEKNADYFTIAFLLIISGLVLIIAWINYINLYTSKANERSKEVGIRKTNGSSKKELFFQFMIEAGLLNLLSLFLAIGMVVVLNSYFQDWLGITLATDILSIPLFWLGIAGFWLFSTGVSGFYPALILTKLSPLKALIASRTKSQKLSFRKVMIVWQFLASSALVVATLVIGDQIRFMNNQKLGVEVDDTYIVEVRDYNREPRQHIAKIKRVKSELMRLPGITKVNYSSDVPGKEVGWRGSSYRVDKTRSNQSRELVMKMTVGPNFINDYGIHLLAGRSYTSAFDTTSVLINEEALGLYSFDSFDDALNSRIYFPGIDTLRVVGIVENFHQESLKVGYKPTAFLLTPREVKYLSIGVRNGQALPNLTYIFDDIMPNQPIEPLLLKDEMQAMHQEETVFLKAFNLFTILALLLSTVGIVGLSSFTVSKREKEIAVRKVLGSYTYSIIWNILREFLKLVVLANLILLPITYLLANEWLSSFAFHTQFNWFFPLISFMVGAILVIFFSFIHIWRVANMNPSDTLNKEK